VSPRASLGGAAMRERLTALVAIALLLVLAGASYWYSIKSSRSALPNRSDPQAPDFIATTVALTQYDKDGRAERRFFADELTHFPDTRVEVLAPRMVSLRPDQPQLEVRAQQALVENDGQKVTLRGQVRVTRKPDKDTPPMSLATERLIAYPDEDRYVSEVPVRLTRGASEATARGMEYDNTSRQLKMAGEVRTVLANQAAGAKP
jgi:lipopolysaccharide export system protein LptC